MRRLSTGLLLLVGLAARAQAVPAPPDTAAALHCLFEQGRLRLALPLTLAVGGGLTALSATNTPATNDPLAVASNRFLTGLAGLATTAFVVAELGQHARYRHRHEQRALAQWQAH